LDYLNENYKLHIITNGFAEVQGRKIKMLSCMIIFILSQTLIWLVKKPNPIIFEYALDLAKANKENSIMIEILWTQMYKEHSIWD
jgi:putative hydrolase of the HAD superfamily